MKKCKEKCSTNFFSLIQRRLAEAKNLQEKIKKKDEERIVKEEQAEKRKEVGYLPKENSHFPMRLTAISGRDK